MKPNKPFQRIAAKDAAPAERGRSAEERNDIGESQRSEGKSASFGRWVGNASSVMALGALALQLRRISRQSFRKPASAKLARRFRSARSFVRCFKE